METCSLLPRFTARPHAWSVSMSAVRAGTTSCTWQKQRTCSPVPKTVSGSPPGLPDKPGNDHAVPPGLAPSGIWETVRPPISFPPAAIFRMSGSVSYWDVAQFVVLLGKHTRPEGM